MDNIKSILVMSTGGTISMVNNNEGALAPSALGFFIKWLKKTPELHDELLAEKNGIDVRGNVFVIGYENTLVIKYTIVEYNPLLDSSNINEDNYKKIAKDIKENYAKYDGFVVLHGTDTLCYTASMLSFMLEHLNKNVIFTGAQIPIFEEESDGKDNFLFSLIFAAIYRMHEVCIYFGHKLMRGNRTNKVDSKEFDAFDSPNYGLLGVVKDKLPQLLPKEWMTEKQDSWKEKEFTVNSNLNSKVDIFVFHPFYNLDRLESMLKSVDGLVLSTYGTGNMPTADRLREILKQAVDRGVIIVKISDCAKGRVNSTYETGKVFDEIGILSGYDSTKEAALTKLAYVLGMEKSLERKKMSMLDNLRGEISIPYKQ